MDVRTLRGLLAQVNGDLPVTVINHNGDEFPFRTGGPIVEVEGGGAAPAFVALNVINPESEQWAQRTDALAPNAMRTVLVNALAAVTRDEDESINGADLVDWYVNEFRPAAEDALAGGELGDHGIHAGSHVGPGDVAHKANSTALDALIALYADWMQQQGLVLGSADEHLFDEELSDRQREWLRAYVAVWDATDNTDRPDDPEDDGQPCPFPGRGGHHVWSNEIDDENDREIPIHCIYCGISGDI